MQQTAVMASAPTTHVTVSKYLHHLSRHHTTPGRHKFAFLQSHTHGSTYRSLTAVRYHDLQVSTSVAALEGKLEGVAVQAAAVQELSQKVDALQGDMAQIKELLLAVLAKSSG